MLCYTLGAVLSFCLPPSLFAVGQGLYGVGCGLSMHAAVCVHVRAQLYTGCAVRGCEQCEPMYTHQRIDPPISAHLHRRDSPSVDPRHAGVRQGVRHRGERAVCCLLSPAFQPACLLTPALPLTLLSYHFHHYHDHRRHHHYHYHSIYHHHPTPPLSPRPYSWGSWVVSR